MWQARWAPLRPQRAIKKKAIDSSEKEKETVKHFFSLCREAIFTLLLFSLRAFQANDCVSKWGRRDRLTVCSLPLRTAITINDTVDLRRRFTAFASDDRRKIDDQDDSLLRKWFAQRGRRGRSTLQATTIFQVTTIDGEQFAAQAIRASNLAFKTIDDQTLQVRLSFWFAEATILRRQFAAQAIRASD
jgi:hypothetical protein